MDVACALLESILPEPVDDPHDMRIVRVVLLVRGAELDQLLEVVQARRGNAGLVRALDRLRQVVKLDLVALDVDGLAITRLTSSLRIFASSRSQSRRYGSAVAITASLLLTLTGKTRNRVAYADDI